MDIFDRLDEAAGFVSTREQKPMHSTIVRDQVVVLWDGDKPAQYAVTCRPSEWEDKLAAKFGVHLRGTPRYARAFLDDSKQLKVVGNDEKLIQYARSSGIIYTHLLKKDQKPRR